MDESELQLYDHIDFSESNGDFPLNRQNNNGSGRPQRDKRLTPKKAAQTQVRRAFFSFELNKEIYLLKKRNCQSEKFLKETAIFLLTSLLSKSFVKFELCL